MNESNTTTMQKGGEAALSRPTRFDLGTIRISETAMQTIDPTDLMTAVHQHQSGDWGDASRRERRENEDSLCLMAWSSHFDQTHILSSFTDRNGTRFRIVTDWLRSVTTILLSKEGNWIAGPAGLDA